MQRPIVLTTSPAQRCRVPRRAAPRTPGLLALQRAAGNRAVTGLIRQTRQTQQSSTPDPATVVVQRRPWLEDPEEYVYRDKLVPNDLAFVTNAGGSKNLGVFIDYTNLEALRDFGKKYAVLDASMIVANLGSTKTKDFMAAVGTVWQESTSKGRPLKAINPWSAGGIGVVMALINLAEADGPKLRREGGGSRLPHAEGVLLLDSTWAGKDDLLIRGLGIEPDDLGDYVDVKAVPVASGELIERKLDAQRDGVQYIAGSGYLYVSTVVTRPRAGRKPRVKGKQFHPDLREVTDADKLKELHASYEAIRTPPASTGWVADLAGGREGSQDKAMGSWSAYGVAAFHNRYRADKGGTVPVDADNWEWLHIRGAQIGGETDPTNLLAGTFAANSQMIPYEAQLQRWHQGNHGKIWARFTAEARDLVLAERIVIEVATHQHAELGTIPREEPLRVEFHPLTGRVVDRLLGHLTGREWREEARLRGSHPSMGQLIELGPPPVMPGTGQALGLRPPQAPALGPAAPKGGAGPMAQQGALVPASGESPARLVSVRVPLLAFLSRFPMRADAADDLLGILGRTGASLSLLRGGRSMLLLRGPSDAPKLSALSPLLSAARKRRIEGEAADAPERKQARLEAVPGPSLDEFEVELDIANAMLDEEPSLRQLPWFGPFGGGPPPPPPGGMTT